MNTKKPLRQIVLDLETTGLEVTEGHRIIEFYALEMIDRRIPSGKGRQYYFNPERSIDAEARDVHGLSNEFLSDKPKFAELAGEIIDFIRGAELIIHNAEFDVGFLNAEFDRLNLQQHVEQICPKVIDTLQLARDRHREMGLPGRRNTLDALCDEFEIDRSKRKVHQASIDCELLAKVYLRLIKGQQASFDMSSSLAKNTVALSTEQTMDNLSLTIRHANEDELLSHEEYIAQMGTHALWHLTNAKKESAQ